VGLTELKDTTLGTTLDALLAQLAATDDLVVDEARWVARVATMNWLDGIERQELLATDRRIIDGWLTVFSSWIGWNTEFACQTVRTRGGLSSWTLDFELVKPSEKQFLEETDPRRALERLGATTRNYSRRASSECVHFDALRALGACLRGDADRAHELLAQPIHHVDPVDPGKSWLQKPRFSYTAWGELHFVLPRDDGERDLRSPRRRRR
jgi:hypothetical protein